MKKKLIPIIIDNIKTLIFALIIAVLIRSLFFQPFYIPSSSMEPTLLIGDRIFVNKYKYGYSKHSFPFSPNISDKRFFYKSPQRGDLVVFKTPVDNRTDYIKRLIGLPGETIQFIDGDLFINNQKVIKSKMDLDVDIRCGPFKFNTDIYKETMPNGKSYYVAYNSERKIENSDKYVVPDNHYFLIGDNRDCSKDSRFLSSVGYVNQINLVGKASLIFFSNDTIVSPLLKFWNINESVRIERFFKKL